MLLIFSLLLLELKMFNSILQNRYNKGDSLTILPSRYSSTTSGGDITARRLIRDASQVLSVLEDEEKSMTIARSTFNLWKRNDMRCLNLVNESEQPRGLLLDTSKRSIVLCGGLSWLRRGSAVYIVFDISYSTLNECCSFKIINKSLHS